ncbi:MAG: formylglycine-generating enzyme family protein [Chloroflexota bacterium]
MAIFYLILGVLAATLLGVLSDWLVKPHLPEKPTQRHIVTAIVVCVVLIAFAVLPYLITPSSTEVPVSPTKLSPTALFISTNIFAPTNTAIILIATPTRSPIPPTLTPAPLPSSTPAVSSTQVSTKDGMVLIYIPAGDFLMGSADSDKEANSDEKPQHKVYLDAFWIDKTEVTNVMYARCVQAGACQTLFETKSFARSSYYTNAQFKDFPVIYVSWDDAGKYCKWAERRLPTEAEWEKAARGAIGRLYPWGDDPPNPSLLNFNKNVGDTTQVGKYPDGASTYGVLDMAGNVWEWVADWYDEKYYSKSPNRNPDGPASGGFGILRGGAWVTEPNYVRAAQRLKVAFDFRDSIVGFRCAR